ncbi:hypothetical protein SNOG_12134 [Parastagonospora nodorum SN15]|uniref:Uncharacterized protein n=1 Tax=Phaeosphaeria nodorum (strain SN15 / ATCC MYA-4574 / FGSC 10173) TaxID=321614 RepID=Q0U7Y0_PHANO|nr:hypothetical protein SNOG_12134 [Parastagonospora nodorum SN15]EAT80546.1 hypothetical protein SNOG_12134 [Parastagonospora nodorum SN15]
MACGDRRNGEIRAHVMSEKEYHSEPEWLGGSRKSSSMTVWRHAVDVQAPLRIWMTIAKYHVRRVTPRVDAKRKRLSTADAIRGVRSVR